jgi:uncharacterized protein YkwD
MIQEILTGLFIQAQVLLNSSTPKAQKAQVFAATPPEPSALPVIYESTDLALPSPAVKKKSGGRIKGAESTILTKWNVLEALNEYRRNNSAGELIIDNSLQGYAQNRAEYLQRIGKLDKHAGHNEFMKNNGYSKLGFNSVAENQSWNFKGNASGLIRDFYARSPGHNKNQLNPEYTHVGIGISGNYTNLVFGGKKK